MDDSKITLSINSRIVDKNVHNDTRAYGEGWVPFELTLSELAHEINHGHAFSAQFKDGLRKSVQFIASGFLTADFDGTMTLEDAGQNEFIQQYGSLLYVTPSHQTAGMDRFRVVFRTPYIIETAQEWSFALRGLAKHLGADMRATDGARISFGSRNSQPTIIGNLLTGDEFGKLLELGQSVTEAAKKDGNTGASFLGGASRRSFRTIARIMEITLANGSTALLSAIPASTAVHCPFHDDKNPSAFTLRSTKGSPGIHCAVCMQTFWIEGIPRKAYDFYWFEKLAKEKAVELERRPVIIDEIIPPGQLLPKVPYIPIQAKIIDSKFITSVQLPSGVALVRSPKGSGKTKNIEEIVAQARVRKKSVLLIGHRRTLLRELSGRLGLKCYLDDEEKGHLRSPFDTEWARTTLSNTRPDYYAVSVDSLALRLPRPRHYDIVIIDESEQVLSHVCAKTIENPQPILNVLRHYVATAPTIYMLDADLNMVTTGFVMRSRAERWEESGIYPAESIHLVVNSFREAKRQMFNFESVADLEDDLLANAEDGKRIFVACNSKRRAEAIQKWLVGRVPQIRSLLVTAESKVDPAVATFLQDVRTEILKYDVVLASPAIGTGIDITFEGGAQKIDVVYGFFNARINTHYDIDQQIGRVRNPGIVKVWVSDDEEYFETEAAVIKLDLVETGKSHVAVKGYDAAGNPIFNRADPLLSLQVDAYAVQRASQNRLKHNFLEHKEHNGWQVENVPASVPGQKGSLSSVCDEIMQQRIVQLLSAKKINKQQYDEYIERSEKGEPIGVIAGKQVERHEIEEFYGEDVSDYLILRDNEGRYQEAVLRYEALAIHQGQTRIESELGKYWIEGKWREAFSANTENLLDALIVLSGLFRDGKFDPGLAVTRDGLEPFIVLCKERKATIEMEFGVPIRPKEPIKTLNTILNLVGLAVENKFTKKIEGRKVYFYQLMGGLLNGMEETVKLRDKMRYEKANPDLEYIRTGRKWNPPVFRKKERPSTFFDSSDDGDNASVVTL